MLRAEDISAENIKHGIGGYKKKATEEYVEGIRNEYDALYKENLELKDKLAVLSEGVQYYKNMENSLQKALVLAERTTTETVHAAEMKAQALETEAQAKAELITKEAQLKASEREKEAERHADTMIKDAQHKVDKAIVEGNAELGKIHSQIMTLVQQYEQYKSQYKQLALAQMSIVESEAYNLEAPILKTLQATLDQAGKSTVSVKEESIADNIVRPVAKTAQEEVKPNATKDDKKVYLDEQGKVVEVEEYQEQPMKKEATKSKITSKYDFLFDNPVVGDEIKHGDDGEVKTEVKNAFADAEKNIQSEPENQLSDFGSAGKNKQENTVESFGRDYEAEEETVVSSFGGEHKAEEEDVVSSFEGEHKAEEEDVVSSFGGGYKPEEEKSEETFGNNETMGQKNPDVFFQYFEKKDAEEYKEVALNKSYNQPEKKNMTKEETEEHDERAMEHIGIGTSGMTTYSFDDDDTEDYKGTFAGFGDEAFDDLGDESFDGFGSNQGSVGPTRFDDPDTYTEPSPFEREEKGGQDDFGFGRQKEEDRKHSTSDAIGFAQEDELTDIQRIEKRQMERLRNEEKQREKAMMAGMAFDGFGENSISSFGAKEAKPESEDLLAQLHKSTAEEPVSLEELRSLSKEAKEEVVSFPSASDESKDNQKRKTSFSPNRLTAIGDDGMKRDNNTISYEMDFGGEYNKNSNDRSEGFKSFRDFESEMRQDEATYLGKKR